MGRSLSVVVPVYDGASFIKSSLAALHQWLARGDRPSELLVVDDGSGDATADRIAEVVRDTRASPVAVRALVNHENRGKGYSVRRGLLEATGAQRVFIDADLTYPADNITTLLEALDGGADLAIANRVHARSRYVVAPDFFRYIYTRHNLGRVFNRLVRTTAVRGLRDTQAGLKAMTRETAERLLPLLRMNRFSFDVELLHAAQRMGLAIADVPVTYVYEKEPSTVQLLRDSVEMVRDIARIRARSARGGYDAPASPPGPEDPAVIDARTSR